MVYGRYGYGNVAVDSSKNNVMYDVGLRTYMIGIYKYMSIALMITTIAAFLVHVSTLLQVLVYNPIMFFVLAFSPLIMLMYMNHKFTSFNFLQASNCLWIFAGLMGLSLSVILERYTGEGIARAFLVTAITFGGMSIYGYTTKKDLSGIGSACMMILFGCIVASIVNLFIGSGMINFVLSVVMVVLFTGLIAFDTQKLRDTYYTTIVPMAESIKGNAIGVNDVRGGGVNGDDESSRNTIIVDFSHKVAVYGAIQLYLDCINLFLLILRFVGTKKEN